MKDLNNLFYFARIVEHGSLSAASTALGVAKSVLSEHLSRLEADLGVRLLQRDTRKLQITDVGARYYQRCRVVLAEVERADSIIDEARGTPRGVVRVACPVNFAQTILAPLLVDFMRAFPEIELVLDMTNREVDLIAEGYDVVLRIAPGIRASSLAVRSFVLKRHLLVASPSWIETNGLPCTPEDLRGVAGLGGLMDLGRGNRHGWRLTGPQGEVREIVYSPRLITEDIVVIKQAALVGCGVAELPTIVCHEEIASGRLVTLLPDWSLPDMTLYVVFASRKGIAQAVRCLIDHLSEHLRGALEQAFSEAVPAEERLRLVRPG